MGLTVAPWDAWYLGWVAIAPLWVMVRQRCSLVMVGPHVSTRRSLVRSLLWAVLPPAIAWGLVYHGMALFWITGVHPMDWMGVPWLASITIAFVCWAAITLWGAAIVVSWAAGMAMVHRYGHSRPWLLLLWGMALWSGIEWLWSRGDLYWSAIAYSQSPHNLVILHLGQLSGPWTVTVALVGVNGLLAEAWLHRTQIRQLTCYGLGAIALWMGLHGLGGLLYLQPLQDSPDAALTVGIIQGNIPNTIKLYDEGWRRAIEGYTTGYRTLSDQGVDVVLTPETALPSYWRSPLHKRTSMYAAIVEEQTPIWLGAFGGGGNAIANSLFTVLGDGTTLNEYRKVKLVPLGEYIPFQRWLGGLINRLSPLDAQLVRGTSDQVFDTPFGRMVVGICYESAFPQHFQRQTAAGGRLILTASNNAHYAITMPAQHHAQDVMRAIESDRWAVRATNTGYSGIVDAHGHTLWMSDINTYELHAHTVYRRDSQTLYVRWGNWLTPALGGMAIAFSLLISLGQRPSPRP